MIKDYCTQNNNICYTCSLASYENDCKNNKLTEMDIIIANCIEQFQEIGKVKVDSINNLGDLMEELENHGYNTTLSNNADYLIIDS